MTVTDLYNQKVKSLSPSDRLRLASLILNDLTGAVDEGTEWLPQDYADFTNANWERVNKSAAEPEDA